VLISRSPAPSCGGQEIQDENWTRSKKIAKEIVEITEEKGSQEEEALDDKETKRLFYDTSILIDSAVCITSF
jgi:hypothetical protein